MVIYIPENIGKVRRIWRMHRAAAIIYSAIAA